MPGGNAPLSICADVAALIDQGALQSSQRRLVEQPRSREAAMALLRPPYHRLTRRALLRRSALAGRCLVAAGASGARALRAADAPAVITSERMRPRLPYGVQSGDLAGDRAIIWARADRPARMMVEWATTESFADARLVRGPAALEDSDFTAKLDLAGLPPGERVFYRVAMVDLADHELASEPVAGSFWTPPAAARDIRFVWSADTAGQGWGINPDWGGMRIYETMRQVEPAFFIHSGDTIYADGPIAAEVADAGRRRLEEPDHRGQVQGRRDACRVPRQLRLQPDGRATSAASTPRCRCSPSGTTTRSSTTGTGRGAGRDQEARYKEKSVALLAARGLRAFIEYMPVRRHPLERGADLRELSLWPRRSRCSGSTCAPIAARTRRTTRPNPGPTRRSSGPSRCAG